MNVRSKCDLRALCPQQNVYSNGTAPKTRVKLNLPLTSEFECSQKQNNFKGKIRHDISETMVVLGQT